MPHRFARVAALAIATLFGAVAADLAIARPQDQTSSGIPAFLERRERAKWTTAEQGKATNLDQLDYDFYSLNYMPDGTIKPMTKDDIHAAKSNLPAVKAQISGFKVIACGRDCFITTYEADIQADVPAKILASSVWVKKNTSWKTVFFQETKVQ
jgi:hypothetical protein